MIPTLPHEKRRRIARSVASLSTAMTGVLITSLSSADPVHSQSGAPGLPTPSFPAPIQQPLPTLPEAPKPSPLKPDLPSPGQPVTPKKPPSDSGSGKVTEIPVCGFRFVGNTVFRDEQLKKEIDEQGFVWNEPMSFSKLNKASQAITNYYVKKGYETSGAYIPQQRSRDAKWRSASLRADWATWR
jgi:hemolysin activation/secretion protein